MMYPRQGKHRAPYSRHGAQLDAAIRGIYNQHGYLIGSLREHGGYGKHSPNRSAA
jgi:hypothetical protein